MLLRSKSSILIILLVNTIISVFFFHKKLRGAFFGHEEKFFQLKRLISDSSFFTANRSRITSDEEPKKPANPEWEQLNKFAFFRRSAAVYHADKQLLRIFYVTHVKIKDQVYEAEVVPPKSNHSFKNQYLRGGFNYMHYSRDSYFFFSLNFERLTLEGTSAQIFLIDR